MIETCRSLEINNIDIVTRRLQSGIVEQEKTAVAR
jgi:hypothetical protein